MTKPVGFDTSGGGESWSMGISEQKPKNLKALDVVGGASSVFSEARKSGRRVILKFRGTTEPELDRIECRWSEKSQASYWQTGDERNAMSWTKVPQALSLIFLDYLAAGRETVGPVTFSPANGGILVTALGNAISIKDDDLHQLFMEKLGEGRLTDRVKLVFGGKNIHGKEEGERRIFIRSDFVPPDCIQVYWESNGPEPIAHSKVFQLLAERIRKSLGIELPPPVVLPVGDESVSKLAAPAPETTKQPAEKPESKALAVQAELPISKTEPKESQATTPRPAEKAKEEPELSAYPGTQEKPAKAEESRQEEKASKKSEPKPESTPAVEIEFKRRTPPRPTIPPIPAELFEIQNPQHLVWEDDAELLDLGDGEGDGDVWKIKDASEGVLILGAPGSGKTSGSGFSFAASFLSSDFGGLVMAAKSGEARRWKELCARFGRAEDCIVVTPNSNYKLNPLAYETQRPGERLSITDDLIAFFRVLIAIVSKRPAASGNDDFWTNATNQLMRELFDLFLLSGEPLTVDNLTRFVTKAPEEPTETWPNIPYFGEVILRAEQNQKTDEDRRIAERVKEYWTETYPSIAHQTRSGIELGFTAMANALSGRGIHNLISTETTLTPEMILSGKIVILDLPLKECGQGGHLIQAAWKYLFQRAVERRVDKGMPTARPVFLWEDEGHLFFSQHDIEFQPTARDCRAAHVIISQSLHNFYQLGHNPHAVQGVFATMNTHVFHSNGDLDTNKWASERIGTTLTSRVNVSISSHPKSPKQSGYWLLDMFSHGEEQESNTSTSVQQHRERLLEPEAFSQLKKGGDGTCQAVVLWVAHQFKCNRGRPFRVTTFAQDSNQ